MSDITTPLTDAPPVDVLIVDDDDDQRTILRRYFERAGCRVVVAADADEAVSSYRERPPHLAVIDLVLPGMDGWELTALVRSDLPDCAIAITSVLEESDYPSSDAVLPKPVTGEHVRRVLRDHVPQWRER